MEPSRKNNAKSWLGFLVAGFVAAGVSVAIFAGARYYYQLQSPDGSSALLDNGASAEVSPSEVKALQKTAEGFRAVAKTVGPAVVKIKATKGRTAAPQRHGQRDGAPEQNPFFDFPFPFPGQPERDVPQESLGSGFIIDSRGYIITNNHVIADADKIVVALWNEKKGNTDRELKAKVIGTDPKTDLAVLKIEGESFPHVEWADSEAVEVGDWAVAIGSPFSLTHTVTVGIVSAKGRPSRVIGADYAELLQTDAAINPGNSGGPLCTISGQVMGVNTAIYTRSGGYMGIGFAIPSGVAKQVADTLIKDGKIIRGWLGVYIQPIDDELMKELNITQGVSVHAVMEESPAAKAGIEAGDVVVNVEGKEIEDVTELQKVIASFRPGQKVQLEVMSYRTKKRRKVTVNIGELPDAEPEAVAENGTDAEPDKLGLVVDALSRGKGVIVKWVESGSTAERIGIQKGDTIVRINRQEIASVADYEKMISKTSGRVSMAVNRKGRAFFFRFFMPKE